MQIRATNFTLAKGNPMAIAGGAVQSFELKIVNGQLVVGEYAHRQGVEQDIDIAIHRLLDGNRVFLHAYGNKVECVSRTVRAALAMRAKWEAK